MRGFLGADEDNSFVYYLGIIDVLQEYNIKKWCVI
jgi:hypothetical protein